MVSVVLVLSSLSSVASQVIAISICAYAPRRHLADYDAGAGLVYVSSLGRKSSRTSACRCNGWSEAEHQEALMVLQLLCRPDPAAAPEEALCATQLASYLDRQLFTIWHA